MAGLGPNNTSLLERTGKAFEMTLDWLEMDRQERGQARRVAVIKWATKHKKQQKPSAPVEETEEGKINKGERLWKWIGEAIPTKELFAGHLYSSSYLRLYGFRLPKLKTKGKN